MNLCTTCSSLVAGQLFGIRLDSGDVDFALDALVLTLGVEHTNVGPDLPSRIHYVWVTPELNGDEIWGDRDLESFHEQFTKLPEEVEVLA